MQQTPHGPVAFTEKVQQPLFQENSGILIIPDFHLKRSHLGRAKSSGTHNWSGGGGETHAHVHLSLKATLLALVLSPTLGEQAEGNCLLDPVALKPVGCLVIFSVEILVQARQMNFSIITQDAQYESHSQVAPSFPWVGAITVNP